MRVRIGWSSLPAILCLLYLVSCLAALVLNSHADSIMKKLTPAQAEAQAEAYIDLLRANHFDQIEKELDPSIVGDDTNSQLAFMASLFPAQQPLSVKVVGVHVTGQANLAGTASSDLNINLEYQFPSKWLLASLVMRSQNGNQTIVRFSVDELTDSLEHSNRLTLAGKGIENYLILLMFFIDMGLTFYVLVLCLRTGVSRKNWFWPILCLVGVGRFAVNWTTGQANFTALWISFPPQGANGTLYSPWTVYAAVPLGAILYLLFGQARQPAVPARPPAIPVDSPFPAASRDQPQNP